ERERRRPRRGASGLRGRADASARERQIERALRADADASVNSSKPGDRMRFHVAVSLALLFAGPALAVPDPINSAPASATINPVAIELVEAAYPKEVFPA